MFEMICNVGLLFILNIVAVLSAIFSSSFYYVVYLNQLFYNFCDFCIVYTETLKNILPEQTVFFINLFHYSSSIRTYPVLSVL